MGNNPIPPPPQPTLYEQAREYYVDGILTLAEFEYQVGVLLFENAMDLRPSQFPRPTMETVSS